jgi:hypothetical protein
MLFKMYQLITDLVWFEGTIESLCPEVKEKRKKVKFSPRFIRNTSAFMIMLTPDWWKISKCFCQDIYLNSNAPFIVLAFANYDLSVHSYWGWTPIPRTLCIRRAHGRKSWVLSFFPHNLLAKNQPLKRVFWLWWLCQRNDDSIEQENGDAAHYSEKLKQNYLTDDGVQSFITRKNGVYYCSKNWLNISIDITSPSSSTRSKRREEKAPS